jgi:hypothetical protein
MKVIVHRYLLDLALLAYFSGKLSVCSAFPQYCFDIFCLHSYAAGSPFFGYYGSIELHRYGAYLAILFVAIFFYFLFHYISNT